MSDLLRVRRETPLDHDAIRSIVETAFKGTSEVGLIERLRDERELTLSLVAEAPEPVGHLAFSPIHLSQTSGVKAWALAPLAVLPRCQRSGIGTALVNEGLRQARDAGVDVVLVLGDPHYYGRFGFSPSAAASFKTVYDGPYLQALHLSPLGAEASGTAVYARAFEDLA